jgi:LPS export ABC transporter protein LptC
MKKILAANPSRPRRYRTWMWLLGLALLLGLGTWGFWGRTPAPKPPKPAPAAKTGGRMEGLALTEIQDGDRRWVLEAKKADLNQNRLEIHISGVRVEFYGPEEQVRVRADEGLFHTKSRVLTLKGHVEMARGDVLIKTGEVTYQPSERTLIAPGEVFLAEPRLKVQGKNLRVDLAGKKLSLAQHVLTEIKTQEWGLKP